MRGRQLHLFGFNEDRRKIKKRYLITLPFDTCILIGVIIIFLFVFVFSLGIEHGKKVSYNYFSSQKIKEREGKDKKDSKNNKQKLGSDTETDKNTEETENIYVIQVASYSKEESALREANKLKNKGYPVLVTKKGNYVVIFVGKFKHKDEAIKSMQPLKKKYKDCFVRRL
jgi:hypothetical protein